MPPRWVPVYFELLQTIAALSGELGRGPLQREVAAAYGCTKQCIQQRVARLRKYGLVEGPDSPVLLLTHNGKLLLEVGLDAGLKE